MLSRCLGSERAGIHELAERQRELLGRGPEVGIELLDAHAPMRGNVLESALLEVGELGNGERLPPLVPGNPGLALPRLDEVAGQSTTVVALEEGARRVNTLVPVRALCSRHSPPCMADLC